MRASRGRGAGVRHLSLSRRQFTAAALSITGGIGLLPARALAGFGRLLAAPPALSPDLEGALGGSDFVYVSPLRSDGTESRCHAEVWYAWIDGAVVMIASSEGWKARSIRRGLDRARIWVGDYGRVKGLDAGSEPFRNGPHFEAKAAVRKDDALLEKLLTAYEAKYPAEIVKWKPRFRAGHASGERVLIRYVPEPAAP